MRGMFVTRGGIQSSLLLLSGWYGARRLFRQRWLRGSCRRGAPDLCCARTVASPYLGALDCSNELAALSNVRLYLYDRFAADGRRTLSKTYCGERKRNEADQAERFRAHFDYLSQHELQDVSAAFDLRRGTAQGSSNAIDTLVLGAQSAMLSFLRGGPSGVGDHRHQCASNII